MTGCKEDFLDELLVACSTVHLPTGQELLCRGDISRELVFILDGTVEVTDGNHSGDGGGDAVVAVISSDSPDRAPCVGEVSFFLGLVQPYTVTVRSHGRGDVFLLVFGREEGDALMRKFPDQREVVRRNLLRAYGLEPDGSLSNNVASEASAAGSGIEDDVHRSILRAEMRAAMLRRGEESFASLVIATKSGDLESVRHLLSPEALQRADYDGRTVLAHAAASGAYRIAELLVVERSDVAAVNRWGQTPLDEAVDAGHPHIAQLLVHRRARTGDGGRAAALVEAASMGDVVRVERILEERLLDPNARDYDGRTGLCRSHSRLNLSGKFMLT